MPDVSVLESDIYGKIAECFNTSWFSTTAARVLWRDRQFGKELSTLTEPAHLPNHHLGRYAGALNVPYVITVHDLIRYFDMSREIPLIHKPNARDRVYLKRDVAGIKNATGIIAVSLTTKYDLMEYLGIPEERIHVVYEGVAHERFQPGGSDTFPFPYILYVGSEHPRKNVPELLAALREVKDSGIAPDLKLVKVGKAGGAEDDFRGQTRREIERLGLSDSVVFAGRISDRELVDMYSSALCTVLPSLYEGFGLPVLEAMACGSPVIVSSGGSLPEIAGDAGIVVSPRDPSALAGAITSMLTNSSRRERMVERGLARAATFSWERTALETRRVYEMIEADYMETVPAAPRPVAIGERTPGIRLGAARKPA